MDVGGWKFSSLCDKCPVYTNVLLFLSLEVQLI
jgi:hypothetical protein